MFYVNFTSVPVHYIIMHIYIQYKLINSPSIQLISRTGANYIREKRRSFRDIRDIHIYIYVYIHVFSKFQFSSASLNGHIINSFTKFT